MIGKLLLVLFLSLIVYNILFYEEPSGCTSEYSIWDTINLKIIFTVFISAIIVEGSFSLYEKIKLKIKDRSQG